MAKAKIEDSDLFNECKDCKGKGLSGESVCTVGQGICGKCDGRGIVYTSTGRAFLNLMRLHTRSINVRG